VPLKMAQALAMSIPSAEFGACPMRHGHSIALTRRGGLTQAKSR
jgi:hypothetical protein